MVQQHWFLLLVVGLGACLHPHVFDLLKGCKHVVHVLQEILPSNHVCFKSSQVLVSLNMLEFIGTY